ncbi:MAG: SEC-C metal-binding domain-containing protein [Geminicoccales bacterium]
MRIHAYFLEQRDAYLPEVGPFIRTRQKIGRNAPCPCGSGLKYKKCCGSSLILH